MYVAETVATVFDILLGLLMVFGMIFSDSEDAPVQAVQILVVLLMIYNIWLIWN